MSSGLLEFPRLELLREQAGRIDAALIHLQDPSVKAVRCVHPHAESMVYFDVDAQGVPVSLVFHEPVFGEALWEIVSAMCVNPAREAAAASPESIRGFVSDAGQLGRILVRVAEAVARMLEDRAVSFDRGGSAA
jgi:hypothetical protein